MPAAINANVRLSEGLMVATPRRIAIVPPALPSVITVSFPRSRRLSCLGFDNIPGNNGGGLSVLRFKSLKHQISVSRVAPHAREKRLVFTPNAPSHAAALRFAHAKDQT